MSRPPSDPSLPQDPHLQAALRHAPDADAQAPAALSARILEAAREQAARQAPPQPAAAPRARSAPAPWWKRLLGEAGPRGYGPRWAGGLALLFVTVIAGLIWIPDRPGVDTLPPRPQAQTAPPQPQQARKDEGAAPATELRSEARPGAAPPATPPAPQPRDKLAGSPPRATRPAPEARRESAAAEVRESPPEAARAAAPPPAPAPLQQAEPVKEALAPEPEKKAARLPDDRRARAVAALAKPAAAAVQPIDVLRIRLLAAPGVAQAGNPPRAQAPEQDAAFAEDQQAHDAAAGSPAWRLPPEGRPQRIGRPALAWLDRLAAATGRWEPAEAPPAGTSTAAWTVQWLVQDQAAGRLLIAGGHAWWQAEDGSWWQAAVPPQAAATLQRDARQLLETPDARKPGPPR